MSGGDVRTSALAEAIRAAAATGTPHQVELPDGRVELLATAGIDRSPLYNEDLAPVPVVRRTWSTYNYAALWISMAHCIPTYMLASGLMTQGMNWKQALFTILLGNTIVLIPILLNSHPGTKYGIPFPVFARAAYGTAGSNLPALMRALVACGWFGIQAWIGGEAVNLFFATLIPGWSTLLGPGFGGHTTTAWLSFLLFWGLNIWIIYRGMNLLRIVENWAAPYVLIVTGVLLVWAVRAADGFGPLLSQPGKFETLAEFLPVFIPSLTAMIGFWATLSLNMPDFTRFGRSQREQMIGQTVALPTTMFVFAAMGVLITSASAILYGAPIWDPVKLVGNFRDPLVVGVAMFSVVVATLAVNIAANVVSPANDFANALPRWISFKTGGLITGIIGILMQPWRLLADPGGYIFTWLVGYSGGLGSIAGVLIADYWIVRRRRLKLADLYLPDGEYAGWNPPAVIATLVGCALAWGGLVVAPLRPLYDYAWFVGFLAAAVLHVALSRRAGPAAARA
jgi:NCS1 family nucleobase:cation symporter-1